MIGTEESAELIKLGAKIIEDYERCGKSLGRIEMQLHIVIIATTGIIKFTLCRPALCVRARKAASIATRDRSNLPLHPR